MELIVIEASNTKASVCDGTGSHHSKLNASPAHPNDLRPNSVLMLNHNQQMPPTCHWSRTKRLVFQAWPLHL